MQPQDFAALAQAMAQGGAAPLPLPGLGRMAGPGDAAAVRLAAGCSGLFLARPPLAPGAVICGATHRPAPGLRAHAAGIGPDAASAWVRAMSEVAETRALIPLDGDPRVDADGMLPLVDDRLLLRGRIPAAQVLRPPGLAGAVHGMAAAPDPQAAARAALAEAVERHAIALWFAGLAPARPLPAPQALRRFEAALRRDVAGVARLRFLHLPGAMGGLSAVVALTEGDWGILPGYGCAQGLMAAACKAATEAVMAEFGWHLETRAGAVAPPDGMVARGRLFASRPDLTHPLDGAVPPPAPLPPVRLAVLDRPGDGLSVLRAMVPGLRVPDADAGSSPV